MLRLWGWNWYLNQKTPLSMPSQGYELWQSANINLFLSIKLCSLSCLLGDLLFYKKKTSYVQESTDWFWVTTQRQNESFTRTHKTITHLWCHHNTIQRNKALKNWDIAENYFKTLHRPPYPQGGCFIGLLFLLWQCKMKPLAPADSGWACMEAKINTAISEQDLSGVHFFPEVTEE